MAENTVKAQGLYSPQYEHDACGVGFVVNMDGRAEHGIVERGVQVLVNLLHRGATGADVKTGDGAGLLLQIPHRFSKESLKMKLPAPGHYAVGMLFVPQNEMYRKECVSLFEKICAEENFKVLSWRDVPAAPDVLGNDARREMPKIVQVFLTDKKIPRDGADLERALLIVRKRVEHECGRRIRRTDSMSRAFLPARLCTREERLAT